MKLPSLFLASNFVAAAFGLTIDADSLRTEGAKAPLGIHPTKPKLSWRLSSDRRGDSQTAYQIQAASSLAGLGGAGLWDSGKVASTRPYADWGGVALGSRKQVFWRARVWDSQGAETPWTEPTTFELGFLNPTDWSANWITNLLYKTGTNSLPMFAKDFKIDCAVDKARLYITGLGVFRGELNGEPVTDELMGPGYTTINRTLHYRVHDVTNLMKQGGNAIGVAVGKGIYNVDRALGGR
jgi:hypothetical protein